MFIVLERIPLFGENNLITKLIEFDEYFPTEEFCVQHLKEIREKQRIVYGNAAEQKKAKVGY